jgi:hypothetical protein
MDKINKYLTALVQYAGKKLESQFKIKQLNFDDFSLVNSFLIYQTINDKKGRKNTLIYLPEKEAKSEFYIPVILTLSMDVFIDNYILSDRFSQSNNELYKKFFSYQFNIDEENMPQIFDIKSIVITEKEYEEKLKYFSSSLFYLSIPKLKKYIDTNSANKLKPLEYKIFDNQVDYLNEATKIIGARDVKYFKDDLLKSVEKGIHAAFPFQYITKTGSISNNIPCSPMIYVVNDYQTARSFILDKGIKIRSVIFIGASKYNDKHLLLSEDLRNKRIENCLFIGSSDIEQYAIPNLIKWKWTFPELNYFKYFETYDINEIVVENKNLTDLLNYFNQTIVDIEIEYRIKLFELYKFARYLLPITIPRNESGLIKQLDDLKNYFETEGFEIFEKAFFEKDEYNYEEIWGKVSKIFSKLVSITKTCFNKYEKIKLFERIDYLVVPKENQETWKEEIKNPKIKEIISYKEFESLQCKRKVIVFLGFYGWNHLKSIIYNQNKIYILLYSEENIHYLNCVRKFINETYNEIRSPERKTISEISFSETENVENISELISRLFEKNEDIIVSPDINFNNGITLFYEIVFENECDAILLDANKTILLSVNNKEREEKVKNLKAGDKIRIYDNSTKEELYKIALQSDENGIFKEIEKCSNLWKQELLTWAKQYCTTEKLLRALQESGLSIKNEITIKKWLDLNSNVKFPQKQKDLIVLKRSISSEILTVNFAAILKARKSFNGIMIALGRDLSDEITDFIKSSKTGKILSQFKTEQIQHFVNLNARIRIIKSIKIVRDDE